MSISFRNDYGVLAHPRILEAISRHADEVHVPYGLDVHSKAAEALILDTFGCPKGEVHFLAGGTQSNLVLISYALRPYEGVISADTGHINVHEAAAIEGSGHKILAMPNVDGKLTPESIDECVRHCPDEHTVQPKMVYISNSTETGTIYRKAELVALRKICDERGLLLFIDGARLGAALTSLENDVEPSFLGEIADAFSIGGTKNGLLLGEALVVTNPALMPAFRRHIKNKGAMLAKGYLLGIEFEEAFKDGLYFELAKKTNQMAGMLKQGLMDLGLDLAPSPTNQIFVRADNSLAQAFIDAFGCELWERKGEETIVRFVTSFATKEEDIAEALGIVKGLLNR